VGSLILKKKKNKNKKEKRGNWDETWLLDNFEAQRESIWYEENRYG
jgi:hypothetical protein